MAFEAWLATDPKNNPEAPKSPFAMPEYSVSEAQEADRLELEASSTYAKGTEANQNSDDYVLNTVILASVLFLAGVQTRIKSVPVRMIIVILGLTYPGLWAIQHRYLSNSLGCPPVWC